MYSDIANSFIIFMIFDNYNIYIVIFFRFSGILGIVHIYFRHGVGEWGNGFGVETQKRIFLFFF